ncbi:synaptogyrin homolog 1 isoform X2 [Lepisosteus oculatus]
MGTLAFLCCLAFLALDVYFPQISSVKDRKKAVLADVGVSAFWSFMWFVGFCLLANQWQVSKLEDNPLREGADAARAAIAFCFFSVFTWKRKFQKRLTAKNPFLNEATPQSTDFSQGAPLTVQSFSCTAKKGGAVFFVIAYVWARGWGCGQWQRHELQSSPSPVCFERSASLTALNKGQTQNEPRVQMRPLWPGLSWAVVCAAGLCLISGPRSLP